MILFSYSYHQLFDCSIDRTRLRLGFSCLREKKLENKIINSCASSICENGLDFESVEHFFLYCLRYAAQRNVLLTSVANIPGETWSSRCGKKKLSFLLYSVISANYDVNCAFFSQSTKVFSQY